MIDTHSHIDAEEFHDDVEQVILRAREVGVEKILIPNINADTVEPILDLCSRHHGILFPMMGLHPEDVNPQKIDVAKTLDHMETLLKKEDNPYVAVGEVGLDFYWDDTFRTEQIAVFERQVEWALQYHLPLMIHAREAHDDIVKVIEKYHDGSLTGVFHCFAGDERQACQLLEFPGFCLGIGGVLTFKKSTLPVVLKKQVPLERIVLETDAPYLAPVPFRGKRNEPAFVIETAKRLALVYETTPEEVEKVTTDNALRLFSKIAG